MSKNIILCLSLFFAWTQILNGQTQEGTQNKIVIDGQSFYLYEVQKSEGLYRIGKNFGVSQQEILKYNPEAAQGLNLGQVLKIPIIPGRNSNTTELNRNDKYIYHKVEKGQTLFFISKKYNVDQKEIIALNPGVDKSLRIGYELRIPVKEVKEEKQTPQDTNQNFIVHEVKPKETLYFLSKKYNVSVEQIIQSNPGLESGIIQVGAQLKIPQGAGQAIVTTTPKPESKPQITKLEDEDYIYHKLQAGETLYAVSKKYAISQDDILKSNRIEDVSDIPVGYMIRIPKLNVPKENGISAHKPKPAYIIHTAEKGQSIEDLVALYHVSADTIIATNPDVKDKRWRKLKRNSRLKIPIVKPEVPKETEKKNTLPTEDQLFIRDSLIVEEAFAFGCDTLGYDGTINVAFIGPFYTEVNDSLNIKKEEDQNGNITYSSVYPKRIYRQTSIFREYYFGSLLAIDSLKKLGVDINVFTYDVKRDPIDNYSLQSVLAQPEMQNMDLIFGPAHPDQINEVAKFCEAHHIKMVIPFGDDYKVADQNPQVFMLNEGETAHYTDVVDKIIALKDSSNIILVKDATKGNRQVQFADQLKSAVFKKRWSESGSSIEFFEVNYDVDGIAGIEKLITKDKSSVIIIATENEKVFNNILPSLYFLKEKKKFPISLVGFPEYMTLTGNDLEYIFSLNTLVFSQYYVDYNDPYVLRVLKQYRQWFGGEPTVNHRDKGVLHPNNGLLGYDATLYFISAFKSYGERFEHCMDYLDLELTESDFQFKRENNWGGFSNRNVEFIQFTEDFEIYRLN